MYYQEKVSGIFIAKNCHVLEDIEMCPKCWSEDIIYIPENKITAFIRNKRLKKLSEISK